MEFFDNRVWHNLLLKGSPLWRFSLQGVRIVRISPSRWALLNAAKSSRLVYGVVLRLFPAATPGRAEKAESAT